MKTFSVEREETILFHYEVKAETAQDAVEKIQVGIHDIRVQVDTIPGSRELILDTDTGLWEPLWKHNLKEAEARGQQTKVQEYGASE